MPDWYSPQYLNRYSYVRNNPLRYTDPTGHAETCDDATCGIEGSGTPVSPGPDARENQRSDDRIRLDNASGRPAGGDRSGSHTDYDWAGGAILEHYLYGGGSDWTIVNDPRWTQYMKGNRILSTKLQRAAIKTAQDALNSGVTDSTFNETSYMEIENGEGIVGYEYLHGTNAYMGGFQRAGTIKVAPDNSGGYAATLDAMYTWNDKIDPNFQYSTDIWKSTIANIITIGGAKSYAIHITWVETLVIGLDPNANVTSIR